MHDDIELFADATVLIVMMMIASAMSNIDPMLSCLWILATAFMSWPDR